MAKIWQKLNKKLIIILLVGVLIALLGYQLRAKMFNSFPPIGDSEDEVKYAFNGLSLIQKGVPESWSWFDDYGKFETLHIRNSQYRLVKPYFDDPPLFALLSGAYAIKKGMNTYEKVEAGALRWPMLKIGALNIFMLFILVYMVSGFWPALLSGLLYATIPTFVLSSRLSLAENFLTTISLSALLLLVLFLKKNWRWSLFLAAFLAASALLVKQTGMYISGGLFLLLLSQKKPKDALIVLIFAILAFGAWFAYGYHYDWPLFWHLQSIFSGRELGLPKMIIGLFDTFRISEKMMSTDGWLIWGWISVVLFSFVANKKENKLNYFLPLIMIGSYLIIFAIMSGHFKGWYRFPFWPFLSWTMAVVFIDLLKKPKFLVSFFFIAIAGFFALITGIGENYWVASQVKIYQLIFPLIMAPFLFYEFQEKIIFKRLSQLFLVIVFLLMIWFNLRTILFFQDQFWY